MVNNNNNDADDDADDDDNDDDNDNNNCNNSNLKVLSLPILWFSGKNSFQTSIQNIEKGMTSRLTQEYINKYID